MTSRSCALITLEKLERIREQFLLNGKTVQDWAKQNQTPAHLVYAVMSGRSKARRGESHRIAVLLGLLKPDAKNDSLDPAEKEVITH